MTFILNSYFSVSWPVLSTISNFGDNLKKKKKKPDRLDISSFSSSRAASTDFPHSLTLSVLIVHHSREVFQTTPGVRTELFPASSCWSDNTNTSSGEGVHWRMSLLSSPLVFQQCPPYLLRLTWMILNIESKWLYSCCFVGCCFGDLFNTARSIIRQFRFSFFSIYSISVCMVHPYSNIVANAVVKIFCCIYIYIYSHPQTDCFVLSELFSVARHAGRSKPGSKPV